MNKLEQYIGLAAALGAAAPETAHAGKPVPLTANEVGVCPAAGARFQALPCPDKVAPAPKPHPKPKPKPQPVPTVVGDTRLKLKYWHDDSTAYVVLDGNGVKHEDGAGSDQMDLIRFNAAPTKDQRNTAHYKVTGPQMVRPVFTAQLPVKEVGKGQYALNDPRREYAFSVNIGIDNDKPVEFGVPYDTINNVGIDPKSVTAQLQNPNAPYDAKNNPVVGLVGWTNLIPLVDSDIITVPDGITADIAESMHPVKGFKTPLAMRGRLEALNVQTYPDGSKSFYFLEEAPYPAATQLPPNEDLMPESFDFSGFLSFNPDYEKYANGWEVDILPDARGGMRGFPPFLKIGTEPSPSSSGVDSGSIQITARVNNRDNHNALQRQSANDETDDRLVENRELENERPYALQYSSGFFNPEPVAQRSAENKVQRIHMVRQFPPVNAPSNPELGDRLTVVAQFEFEKAGVVQTHAVNGGVKHSTGAETSAAAEAPTTRVTSWNEFSPSYGVAKPVRAIDRLRAAKPGTTPSVEQVAPATVAGGVAAEAAPTGSADASGRITTTTPRLKSVKLVEGGLPVPPNTVCAPVRDTVVCTVEDGAGHVDTFGAQVLPRDAGTPKTLFLERISDDDGSTGSTATQTVLEQ